MAKHSITAVFDTRAHAEQAITQLKSAGIAAADISLLPATDETLHPADTADTKGTGFWASLEQLFGGTEDHATYAESIRRGGIMVTVRSEDDHVDRIIDILEQHGSVDLDERESTWRSEGWTGTPALTGTTAAAGSVSAGSRGLGIGDAGMTASSRETETTRTGTFGAGALGAGAIATASTSADRSVAGHGETLATKPVGLVDKLRDAAEDVVEIVEERLNVGKRSINRGKVRVHTSVVSREVAEDISLHNETVTVDRRTIDRPLSTTALGADPFQERTIEMEQYEEEAVVAKSAHVVGEVGLRKDATDRVETVRDTLRSTKVDVDDARSDVSVSGAVSGLVGQIRDDMDVVGSDGTHVGTVDHVDGGRIKLKKIDPAAGGEHHFLSSDLVKSVAGKVTLAVTAAEAKTRWSIA